MSRGPLDVMRPKWLYRIPEATGSVNPDEESTAGQADSGPCASPRPAARRNTRTSQTKKRRCRCRITLPIQRCDLASDGEFRRSVAASCKAGSIAAGSCQPGRKRVAGGRRAEHHRVTVESGGTASYPRERALRLLAALAAVAGRPGGFAGRRVPPDHRRRRRILRNDLEEHAGLGRLANAAPSRVQPDGQAAADF